MIALKEFVRDTLVQIAQGVEAAQETLAGTEVLINPPVGAEAASAQAVLQAGQRNPAHLIELDLALAPSDQGAMVVVGKDDPGHGSRVRFSIGISFPVQEKARKEPEFELAVEPSSSA